MKSLTRRAILVSIATAILAIIFGLLYVPGCKYRIGMTIEEARGLMSRDYPLEEAAIAYPNGPTPAEMADDPVFSIRVKKEWVTLEFNHYRKLIRIKRWWQRP